MKSNIPSFVRWAVYSYRYSTSTFNAYYKNRLSLSSLLYKNERITKYEVKGNVVFVDYIYNTLPQIEEGRFILVFDGEPRICI
jgi:hypothetical protein